MECNDMRTTGLLNYLWPFFQKCSLGILMLSSSFIGCDSSGSPQSNTIVQADPYQTCNGFTIKRLPTGNELEVSLSNKISENEIIITLKNISNHRIFLPFTRNENGDVGFLGYVTQMSGRDGQFVTRHDDADYAPGLNAIEPLEEIRYKFLEPKKGHYRLRFRYIVDEDLVRLINDSRCFTKLSFESLTRILNSYANAYSPVIDITRNYNR